MQLEPNAFPYSPEAESPVHIRPLDPDDAQAAQRVILDILNGEFGMGFTLDELPDIIDLHGTYVASGQGRFWVATRGAEVVGCIGVLRLAGPDFELRRMYVDPRHRGLGIAQRLLDVLMTWCLANQVDKLYLETNEQWKAAHHIYEKMGFVPVDRADLPPEFPVVRVATGFYRLSLRREP